MTSRAPTDACLDGLQAMHALIASRPQEASLTRAAARAGAKPLGKLCHLCGRMFGSASLELHLKARGISTASPPHLHCISPAFPQHLPRISVASSQHLWAPIEKCLHHRGMTTVIVSTQLAPIVTRLMQM